MATTRLRAWVCVLFLLLVAACNESQVAAEADVLIGGAVQRADGTPVAGARVALMKEPDLGEGFAVFVSVGLACLENDLSVCGEERVTTTSDDGGFTYQLKGADTQSRFGNASIMELASARERSDRELAGPAVNTRFQVQAEQVRIPLRLWEPAIDVVGAGPIVRVAWAEPPPDVFPPAANLADLTRVVSFQVSDGEEVWRASAGPDALELDARILEDTRGGAAVFAEVDDIPADPGSGTDLEVLVRSARVPYVSEAGRPASRGRPCAVDGVAQGNCSITDGRFGAEFRPAGEGERRAVSIDLGTPTDITFAVVRGCAGPCTVEASEDGAAWHPVGAGADPDFAVAPPAPVRGRSVRVTADGGLDRLREVSVWDPSRVIVPEGSLVDRALDEGALPGLLPGDGSRTWILFVLAAVLAALAVAGLVVMRRRRARTT